MGCWQLWHQNIILSFKYFFYYEGHMLFDQIYNLSKKIEKILFCSFIYSLVWKISLLNELKINDVSIN